MKKKKNREKRMKRVSDSQGERRERRGSEKRGRADGLTSTTVQGPGV